MKEIFNFNNYVSDSEDDMNIFDEMMQELIHNYETRYKTTVRYISVAGNVGVWNGVFPGGTVIRPYESVFSAFTGTDYSIRVCVEMDTSEFVIFAKHHDGEHVMKLEFLTENKMLQSNTHLYHTGSLSVSESEKLAKKKSAKLKYNKSAEKYFGKLSKDSLLERALKGLKRYTGHIIINVYLGASDKPDPDDKRIFIVDESTNLDLDIEIVKGYLMSVKDKNGIDLNVGLRNTKTGWVVEDPESLSKLNLGRFETLRDALEFTFDIVDQGKLDKELFNELYKDTLDTITKYKLDVPTDRYESEDLLESQYNDFIRSFSDE